MQIPVSAQRTAFGFLLEDADELLADDLPLLFWIRHAVETREEALLRLHVDEGHVEVSGEGFDDMLGLVLAEEPVVDEHARELVADRLVHEERSDRRVDAAGERAQDPLRADGRTDPLDLLLDHRGWRPGRRSTGDLVQEVLEDRLPVGRVHHLGMELDAVDAALPILERRDRGVRRRRGHRRPGRRRRDRVTVAHPHRLLGRQVVEELRLRRLELGLAEFGEPRMRDLAAEIARHQLHPVADPERRDAELEDRRVDLRSTVRIHRRGAAGEDERGRAAGGDLGRAEPVAHELRVHARLADAAGDQLAVLPAEIDDQDRTILALRKTGIRRVGSRSCEGS